MNGKIIWPKSRKTAPALEIPYFQRVSISVVQDIWTRVGVLNSFLRLSNTPTLIPWEKALVFQVFSFLLHSSVIHIAKIKDASLVVEK